MDFLKVVMLVVWSPAVVAILHDTCCLCRLWPGAQEELMTVQTR